MEDAGVRVFAAPLEAKSERSRTYAARVRIPFNFDGCVTLQFHNGQLTKQAEIKGRQRIDFTRG
jgi:hypothetical protein